MACSQPDNHCTAASTLALRSSVVRHSVGLSLILGMLAFVSGNAAQAAIEIRPSPSQTSPAITLAIPSMPAGEWLGMDGLGPLPDAKAPGNVPILLATHQTKPKPSGGGGSNPSGLPWKSGTQCFTEGFESYRGRKVDVSSLYLGRDSWSGVLGNLRGSSVANAAARPGEIVIALAMLMQGQRFSDCNSGKLDGTFKDIGNTLDSGNLGNTIVRLGWEANGTSYAWSIHNDVSGYKSCFSRLANILRNQAPNIKIEWSMRKDNGASVGADKLYPGDGVVDVIGTSFYDRFPTTNNQAQWDQNYRETKQGGPKGIGTWLDFAKSRGKKLAIAEWAVSDGYPGSGAQDNPFFVEKTFQFLKANSGSLAYEAYFNCVNTNPNIYMIYPENRNPKASSKYKSLWRAGT